MSTHVFAALVTAQGIAANNRGLNEGNTTTLQKLIWNEQVHTTVSAESIRFALRRRLAESGPCNRTYEDDTRLNSWKDPKFSGWSNSNGDVYVDDDLLGFMIAEAGRSEGGDAAEEGKGAAEEAATGKKAKPPKGTATVRRAVLELTRAVSLTPWSGDVTFNAASPGATPSAQKKGSNPVPYATEMHATRYQYGMALTPGRLRKAERAQVALRGLCALGEVAGNHGRFLFDFSPESVVFRITDDPAPRLLFSFEMRDGQPAIPSLIQKVRAGDILAKELVIGGAVVTGLTSEERAALSGAKLFDGVRAACDQACQNIPSQARL